MHHAVQGILLGEYISMVSSRLAPGLDPVKTANQQENACCFCRFASVKHSLNQTLTIEIYTATVIGN